MLVFISVRLQLRPILIPYEMCPHLVPTFFQISIIRQVIFVIVILNWTNSFCLRLNRIHNTRLINNPNQRRLPIHTLQNPFQCLISRNLISKFLSSHTGNGICKQSIFPQKPQIPRNFYISSSPPSLPSNQRPCCKQRGIKLAALQSSGVFDPRGIRQMLVQARHLAHCSRK